MKHFVEPRPNPQSSPHHATLTAACTVQYILYCTVTMNQACVWKNKSSKEGHAFFCRWNWSHLCVPRQLSKAKQGTGIEANATCVRQIQSFTRAFRYQCIPISERSPYSRTGLVRASPSLFANGMNVLYWLEILTSTARARILHQTKRHPAATIAR